jgi:hypothetical protein
MNASEADGLAALREAIEAIAALQDRSWPKSTPGRARWAAVDAHVGAEVYGSRVLIVGNSDPEIMRGFSERGARHVHVPAHAWESLDPAREGLFDVVYCDGLLHQMLEPIALLDRLRRLITPSGTLVLGSMLLADPERSEYLRFVPAGYVGNPTWRFIPGRLACRWMVTSAGFEVDAELWEAEGPRGSFPLVSALLSARPTGHGGLNPAAAPPASMPPDRSPL